MVESQPTSDELKNKGNDFFKINKYEDAVSFYTQAIQ